MLLAIWSVLGALLGIGCLDINTYDGSWTGTVVAEEAVRQGFAKGVRADPLELANVDLSGLTATLTTTDGKLKGTRLSRVTRYCNDTLASLTFDGSPIRTYLMFAELANETSGEAAFVFISLFSDEHVELRIIRGNDLFGVFHLERKE